MKYTFPTIKTIDDVLPAMKDCKEFVVGEREGYIVINYVVMTPELFPKVDGPLAAIRRECRGIIFDPQGNIISRPFHKFFNINEREETQAHQIKLDDHFLLDKLDGSMIRPIFIEKANGFRFGTKMGVTDVAKQAEIYVACNPRYFKFVRYLYELGYTPIFEFLSTKSPIVIKYDEDALILTAIRETFTGEYIGYDEMASVAGRFDIPVVQIYNPVSDLEEFIARTSEETGREGYVLRYTDGHMLKFKVAEYLFLHRSKEIADKERHIIDAILSGTLDDLKSALSDEDHAKVVKVEKEFFARLGGMQGAVIKAARHYKKLTDGSRKEFALNHAKQLPDALVKGIFTIWEEEDREKLRNSLLHTASQRVFSDMRYETYKKSIDEAIRFSSKELASP